MTRKICAITANRADFSRIETILEAVKKHPDLDLQLIVLGSHLLEKTGHTVEEIIKRGYIPDQTIQMELEGGNPVSMTKSVGLAMVELATALDRLKPDIAIAPVDRFESLAMGIAPALMNIHVAHIQGGEVTGTIDESIRHALTKMSHLHFVATEKSRERVIKMGEPAETVFNVGCPGTDLLLRVPPLSREETIKRLNDEIVKGDKKFDPSKPYFLLIQHPVTTEFGNAGEQIKETMEALKSIGHQAIVLWPNIDAGSDDISKTLRRYTDKEIDHFTALALKHIPHDLFTNVLRNVSCLVGNSSTGMRESCYFGTPVVNIGTRQSGRERGMNVVDAPNDRKQIEDAIRFQLNHAAYPIEHIYGDGSAGEKTAEILASIKLPNIQKKITY